MKRSLWLGVALVGTLAASAQEKPAWVIDVCNGRSERVDYTMCCEMPDMPADFTPCIVETGAEGENIPAVVDRSGKRPMLCWKMPGLTRPRAVRTFSVSRSASATPHPRTDLGCDEADGAIRISNRYFEVVHPMRGGGGFPSNIYFRCSGYTDRKLTFYDRLYSKATKKQPMAKQDRNATARVVFKSPLRVVVESETGYGSGTEDGLRAVYRWVYSAGSPAVEVTAEVRRTKSPACDWNEMHFLQLSRFDRYYESFVHGMPLKVRPMKPSGEKSEAVTASDFVVMSSGREAVGVGGGWCIGWDASSEYCYYARRTVVPFPVTEHMRSFEGTLYFGPAQESEGWFSGWLGRSRMPKTFVTCTQPRSAAARPKVDVDGAHVLEGGGARLAFGSAEEGFACRGLVNAARTARFFRVHDGCPGLWRLSFRRGVNGEEAKLDNLAARGGRCERTKDGLRFTWEKLKVGDEAGVVDVVCDVTWSEADRQFEFRLSVANRSKAWGLAATEYPLLGEVAPPGEADVLVPGSNWGATLKKGYRGSFKRPYPSTQCPMQFMAVNLGADGLYIAAHDGASRAKSLCLTSAQDFCILVPAENAGVPGAGAESSFAVVVAPYEGDWWKAAKKYRAWALRQKWASKGPIATRSDYPERLRANGFWFQLGGPPKIVESQITQALDRVAGRAPFGVHWYCWHQIPFDNSYPEYNPALPGFAEAVARMKARGVVVMPYINARLWDRDIPSFAGARDAACKKTDGEPYFETYGSKRWLAPMCPMTPCWQGKMSEVTSWLMGDCGVNGIYLDQIGAARPALCHDPSHGHPLGGGRHWTDGYRALLTPIKQRAAEKGVTLTVENTAEPYMDNIDAYLTWIVCTDEDVPALPAVYGGYTTYFASNQSPKDDFAAWRARQLRDFMWGCQLGWMGSWMLDKAHREHFEFLVNLSAKRKELRPFLVEGELVGEVPNRLHAPPFTVTWNHRTTHDATLPGAYAVEWRALDGRRVLLVGNLGPVPCDYDAGAPWTSSPLRLAPGSLTVCPCN